VAAVAAGVLASGIVLVTRPSDTRIPSGVPGKWQNVFSDDFDGSALDGNNWEPSRAVDGGGPAPFNPDKEQAWFDPGNVSVSDGNAVLAVQHDPRDVDGTTYPLSSGVIESTALRLRPGTFVAARIKVPRCAGCWPAFWGVPTGTWPPEIDILEYLTGEDGARPTFNYIPASGSQIGPRPYGEGHVDYTQGYHVYGLLWTGSTVVPYLDGKLYTDLEVTDVATDEEMAVVLNLSVVSDGAPRAGSSMLVDWVRMWTPA
jgi:beta-glucanase (GH16 family)